MIREVEEPVALFMCALVEGTLTTALFSTHASVPFFNKKRQRKKKRAVWLLVASGYVAANHYLNPEQKHEMCLGHEWDTARKESFLLELNIYRAYCVILVC